MEVANQCEHFLICVAILMEIMPMPQMILIVLSLILISHAGARPPWPVLAGNEAERAPVPRYPPATPWVLT